MTAVRETQFKVRRKIHEIGGSLVVVLPAIWTQAKGVSKGDEVTVSGEVALRQDATVDLAHTRLRLALVQEVVHYTGGNGIHFHHFVVRKLLGSPDGAPIGASSGKFAFSQSKKLADLKGDLDAYLESYEKGRPDFRWGEKPIELRPADLAVVALVQNDDTREVLQAAFVK